LPHAIKPYRQVFG